MTQKPPSDDRWDPTGYYGRQHKKHTEETRDCARLAILFVIWAVLATLFGWIKEAEGVDTWAPVPAVYALNQKNNDKDQLEWVIL